jgi:hypothetical protein
MKLDIAFTTLVKLAQREDFGVELGRLVNGKPISVNSKILSVNSFMNQN